MSALRDKILGDLADGRISPEDAFQQLANLEGEPHAGIPDLSRRQLTRLNKSPWWRRIWGGHQS